MAFEPHLVLDVDKSSDYARTLLTRTASHPGQPLPLALYLFLLEALSYVVAADRARGDGKRPISGLGATAGDKRSPAREHELIHSSKGGAGSAAAAAEGGASGTGAQAGGGQLGAGRTEALAPWHAWVEYLAEVYLHPLSSGAAPAATSEPPSWTSPLHLPSDIASYLQHLPFSPVFDDSTRTLLLAACRSAITRLSPTPSPSQSPVHSSSQTTLDMLMTETSSPSFPRPLPTSTVSSIALVLAAQRKSAVEPAPPPSVSRQVVSSLLQHYVSPTFQQRIDDSGKTWCAERKEDDRLIKQLFPGSGEDAEADAYVVDVEPEEPVEALASETDEDEDKRSIRTGIRDAHATISRKENKIRQLLGDNWQQGPHRSPSSVSSTPSKRGWTPRSGAQTPTTTMSSSSGTVRPQASMSTLRRGMSRDSDDSFAGEGAGDDDDGSHERAHHHRLVSTSSSQTPLIDNEDAAAGSSSPAPSPAGGNSRSFLHRRGASTQGGLIYAPSSLTLPTQSRQPPLSPAGAPPVLQGDHLSPSATTKPFQDLASPRPRVGPPSPRRTSLDSSLDYVCGTPRASSAGCAGGGLPLHRNALTPHEKRELVRRSKKLEGFFGATFQEEAAQRVLVDGRGQQQTTPERPASRGRTNRPAALPAAGALNAAAPPFEPVSPTNTSFPAPVAAPSASTAATTSPSTPLAALPPGSRASIVSTSSAGSARRPSLAPPSPHHHAIPSPSYQFGAAGAAARRQSVLSHSSSFSSIGGGAGSPSRSPSLTPYGAYSSQHRPSSTHSGAHSPAHSVRMHRSSSSPSRRSSSFSSLTSPDYAYFSLEPRRMSTFEREEQTREREERRRKLEKVRRVLGERVPVALVVGDGDGEEKGTSGRNSPPRASAPMAKSRSAGGGGGGGGGIWKGKLKSGKDRSTPPPVGGGDAGWSYVEPAAGARAGSLQQERPGTATSAGGMGRQGVEALTKARKLENLFGDLPPQSLYLSPQASSTEAPSSRPNLSAFAFRHRRSFSDLAGTSSRAPSASYPYHPSASAIGEGEEDPFGPTGARPAKATPAPPPSTSAAAAAASSVPLALRRFATNSTVSSYRQSIASLGYIADRDPAALDDIARVYNSPEGGRSSLSLSRSMAEDDEDEDVDARAPSIRTSGADTEPDELDLASVSISADGGREREGSSGAVSSRGTGGGAEMERSASASSHRAVRQAQKLSAFFGTTRGEIWSMLLNDIQASIEDDPALDDDERDEVLAGVERLRQRVRV
ncbi:hypothetical protein JCM6882_002028 [Rhodosporidiobolus microsporus]